MGFLPWDGQSAVTGPMAVTVLDVAAVLMRRVGDRQARL
jgi:hypothetical protein